MDLEKLFTPIADYLNFIIDFLLFRGIDGYARLNTVNPKLLSYFVFGILIGFVINRAKSFPSVTVNTDNSNNGGDIGASIKAMFEQGKILLFVPLLLFSASLSHIALLLTACFTTIDHGTFKDTLNTALAGGSIQFPVSAVLSRIESYAKTVTRKRNAGTTIAIMIHLIAITINCGITYY